MPEPTIFQGDVYVRGNLSATTQTIPASAISNSQVAAGAPGTYLAASKLQHQHRQVYPQPNTAATTETRVIHVCYGATGTIIDFRAGSIVANIGAATVTVDLKKNGTTVLTAVITLDSANAAYTPEAGTLSVTALVAGDVLTVVITATAGGGTLATGAYCAVTCNEDPLP